MHGFLAGKLAWSELTISEIVSEMASWISFGPILFGEMEGLLRLLRMKEVLAESMTCSKYVQQTINMQINKLMTDVMFP